MQLVLVRHGLPVMEDPQPNVAADPPLSMLGRAQAVRVVDALDKEGVSDVIVSPSLRARQTAEPLAGALGRCPEVCDGVDEFPAIGLGYVPIHVALRERRPEALAIAAGELPAHVPASEFRERVVMALESVVRDHPGRATVAVVCHGGVINAYLAHVLGLRQGMPFPLDYAGVSRVLCSRTGRRTVISVNETQHVRDLLAPEE